MINQKLKNKYFIFMDESGNNEQDRFFVLGILMVPANEIGGLFNFLENISYKIKTRSQIKMNERVDDDFKNKNYDKILKKAKSNRVFEMKFSSINKENEDLYIHILNKYFKQKNYRFSAIVLDRKSDNFKPAGMSHWDRYLNNAAMLIANNIKNIDNGEFVVIADQITQPRNGRPYENYLCNKIFERLERKNIPLESLFGSVRMESHATNFLQLTDILVGAVTYDFIGKENDRKSEFMKIMREKLKISGKLNQSITIHEPNYFSIWKYNSKK